MKGNSRSDWSLGLWHTGSFFLNVSLIKMTHKQDKVTKSRGSFGKPSSVNNFSHQCVKNQRTWEITRNTSWWHIVTLYWLVYEEMQCTPDIEQLVDFTLYYVITNGLVSLCEHFGCRVEWIWQGEAGSLGVHIPPSLIDCTSLYVHMLSRFPQLCFPTSRRWVRSRIPYMEATLNF